MSKLYSSIELTKLNPGDKLIVIFELNSSEIIVSRISISSAKSRSINLRSKFNS